MNDMDIKKLSTEGRNPETTDLDEMSPLEIVSVMNQEDQKVPAAIKPELPKIAAAVEKIAASFKQGGRLFYVGAGTSGRLGVLDAAECVPTFGTDPELVQGLIAGGGKAMTLAVEGAEDDVELGGNDLKERQLSNKDVVVGIAASGRTPYVVGALDYAKSVGADTIALSCNQNSVISQHADTKIEVVVGPEVLSGSTRLKSGTAQKMVLNMLSTAAMVRVGKTYGNLMVDVKPTNKKLVQRSINIIVEVTGVSSDLAETTLKAANYSVKDAIVMISNKMDQAAAEQKLAESGGFVRQAIK
ncbi:N-acetylmuramic acid 6-phosphate etherase [Companilactobacillus nantensis]|uniref:N-acetylmuramic acid 6-phosphate etherase n=1 Tax=Companilactobacillus nantensis DSM 16982 TaxID=1423774 RepID=A0A0R1WM07_9LACO|nr:N-acetylmuramic acid 6-phosphate etherase [Companilactobacillus nantensis]KRM16795.1 N-acetylmuramic acid 6-phosphate etherase [Companilactobacillus nantensis DSM 16982]GEO64233.1 N-acetylmuramic acid 6-phosphate etherase 2 [Companilactobacillus nantensis]